MARQPVWIVVETEPGQVRCILRASDLRVHLDKLGPAAERRNEDDATPERTVELLAIPGQRLDVANLDYRANLAEAQDALRAGATEALCVRRIKAPMIESVIGVITQQDIDNYRDRGS